MTPELTIHGHQATITLRRPDQANRLGPDDLNELVAHIDRVNQRDEVLVSRVRDVARSVQTSSTDARPSRLFCIVTCVRRWWIESAWNRR